MSHAAYVWVAEDGRSGDERRSRACGGAVIMCVVPLAWGSHIWVHGQQERNTNPRLVPSIPVPECVCSSAAVMCCVHKCTTTTKPHVSLLRHAPSEQRVCLGHVWAATTGHSSFRAPGLGPRYPACRWLGPSTPADTCTPTRSRSINSLTVAHDRGGPCHASALGSRNWARMPSLWVP